MSLSGTEILQVLGVQPSGRPSSVTEQTTTNAIAALALTQTFPTGYPKLAGFMTDSVNSAVSAAGTNAATATLLTVDVNNVTTVAASTGVALPAAAAGLKVTVFSNGANNLTVYPNPNDTRTTIDGGTAGSGVTLTSTKRCNYFCVSASGQGASWISAQLGVVSA